MLFSSIYTYFIYLLPHAVKELYMSTVGIHLWVGGYKTVVLLNLATYNKITTVNISFVITKLNV